MDREFSLRGGRTNDGGNASNPAEGAATACNFAEASKV
jgi:hypothetical protein